MSGTTATAQALPTDSGSEYNATSFMIRQLIARINTATAVKVVSVTNSGGVSPIGTVDVLPLVNQVDGAGNPTEHVTVYGLPYCRLQGGTNAIILDPKVGDIGLVVFASRDISSVKANKGQANPGSFRRFSMSDGMYIATILSSAAPTNYIQVKDDGSVNIVSTKTVTFSGTNASLDANGNLHVQGDVVTGTGISLNNHVHTGVQSGTATTGPATG